MYSSSFAAGLRRLESVPSSGQGGYLRGARRGDEVRAMV